MKTLFVNVEHDSEGFTLYTENEIFSGIGDSLDEARASLEESIRLYVEIMKEDKKQFPQYLDGNYEIKYKMDVSEALEIYEGLIGLTALEKLTGISKKQLWTYRNGTKPQQAQIKKLQEGLNRLGRELSAISF
ncbi:MAG: hypothetical protein LUF90_07185 [Rikenellaceae bacterium]|nr:hypothetical protein [Rikenellaceae bacterium]